MRDAFTELLPLTTIHVSRTTPALHSTLPCHTPYTSAFTVALPCALPAEHTGSQHTLPPLPTQRWTAAPDTPPSRQTKDGWTFYGIGSTLFQARAALWRYRCVIPLPWPSPGEQAAVTRRLVARLLHTTLQRTKPTYTPPAVARGGRVFHHADPRRYACAPRRFDIHTRCGFTSPTLPCPRPRAHHLTLHLLLVFGYT